ncbi:MAG: protein kinase [archaeon]|nr:protein kinase [archaeon]
MEYDINELMQEQPDELDSNFYDIIEELGSGSFGKVVHAIDKKDNTECAIKIINKKYKKISSVQRMRQEISILKTMSHPNIVQFLSYNETKSKLYIKMEYIKGGTLSTWLKEHKNNINEEQSSTIINNVLKAVYYLHCHEIYHRDLKPENIMLGDKNDLTTIKIIDFGLSSFLFGNLLEDSEYCGTFIYMAPEQIERKLYGNSVDLWSIGIIMYMLLNNGKHPYYHSGISRHEYIEKVKNIKLKMINKCSPMAKDLLHKLLEMDPEYRYNAEKALKHPWITRRIEDNIPDTLDEKLRKRALLAKFNLMVIATLFFNSQSLIYSKKKKFILSESYYNKAKISSEKRKERLLTKKAKDLNSPDDDLDLFEDDNEIENSLCDMHLRREIKNKINENDYSRGDSNGDTKENSNPSGSSFLSATTQKKFTNRKVSFNDNSHFKNNSNRNSMKLASNINNSLSLNKEATINEDTLRRTNVSNFPKSTSNNNISLKTTYQNNNLNSPQKFPNIENKAERSVKRINNSKSAGKILKKNCFKIVGTQKKLFKNNNGNNSIVNLISFNNKSSKDMPTPVKLIESSRRIYLDESKLSSSKENEFEEARKKALSQKHRSQKSEALKVSPQKRRTNKKENEETNLINISTNDLILPKISKVNSATTRGKGRVTYSGEI